MGWTTGRGRIRQGCEKEVIEVRVKPSGFPHEPESDDSSVSCCPFQLGLAGKRLAPSARRCF